MRAMEAAASHKYPWKTRMAEILIAVPILHFIDRVQHFLVMEWTTYRLHVAFPNSLNLYFAWNGRFVSMVAFVAISVFVAKTPPIRALIISALRFVRAFYLLALFPVGMGAAIQYTFGLAAVSAMLTFYIVDRIVIAVPKFFLWLDRQGLPEGTP